MEFKDSDSTMGFEPTDVSPIARVNINAYQDLDTITLHKSNLINQLTDYTGSANEINFSIFSGEICFSLRNESNGYSRKVYNRPHVISNLIGFPRVNHISEIEDELQFEGIATGSGAWYDERNINSSPDLALTRGGLRTITNNSDSRISNGDWIMWTVPFPGQIQRNKQHRNTERYLLRLEVYRPEVHDVTTQSFLTWMKETNTERLDEIRTMSADNPPSDEYELLYFTLFNHDNLNPLNGDITNLENSLTNLFVAIDSFIHKRRRRVIGQALSQAEPGGRFDIMLGNYGK